MDYWKKLATYVPLEAEGKEISKDVVIWSYGKIAVVIDHPSALSGKMGLWSKPWYMARRDANLLSQCPICDERTGITSMVEMRGQLVHDEDCPLSDDVAGYLVQNDAWPQFPSND